MADYLQKYADKTVEQLGRKIERTYRQAAKEIDRKMKSFWDSHKVISEKMLTDVADGKITEQDYKNWLRNQVFTGDRWKAKLDEVTKVYVNADEEARKMIGETDKDVFVHAANWQARQTSLDVNGAISFDLYDRKTVDRIIRDKPQMLPKWKINEPKDYAWNASRVRNSVAQGIIQGESVYDIGKRLTTELSASNSSKMDMFARTAVTGAQNAGRMDRLHEAQEMGIKVRKKWLSAHDDRVRDAHADLDGVEVDVDQPFHNELGDIMYPGDPSADPANVYNCRCTLIYVYPEYQKKDEKEEESGEEEADKENESPDKEEEKPEEKKPDPEDDEEYIAKEREENRKADERYNEIVREDNENEKRLYDNMKERMKAEEDEKLYYKDYSEFDRFKSKEEFEEYQNKLQDQIQAYRDEIEGIAGARPEREDFASEEDFRIARDQWRTKRFENLDRIEALNDKIQGLEDEYYGNWNRLPSGGFSEVERWRNLQEGGLQSIYDHKNELKEEHDRLIQRRKDLADERLKAGQERPMNTARLVDEADAKGVEYSKPQKYDSDKQPTTDEIIDKVAGGDMTQGSCASLGFCYIGQQDGYDVLDFRDGESRKLFSYGTRNMLRGIAKETGKPLLTEATKTGTGGAIKLVKQIQEGKEYYFVTGRHAAIVRRHGDIMEYLELQSSRQNGWKSFGIIGDRKGLDHMFRWRFGSSNSIPGEALMMDIDDMKESRLLKRMYGYMNTAFDQQHKGGAGHER